MKKLKAFSSSFTPLSTASNSGGGSHGIDPSSTMVMSNGGAGQPPPLLQTSNNNEHYVDPRTAYDGAAMLEHLNSIVKNVHDCMMVRVIGATDLVPKDKNGFSDPYSIVTFTNTDPNGIQENWLTAKTATKKKTLNPSWNETFQINLTECVMKSIAAMSAPSSPNSKIPTSPGGGMMMPFSIPNDLNPLSTSTFNFKIMDYDMFSSDENEGDVSLKLTSIPNIYDLPVNLVLENTEKGSLSVAFKMKCAPRFSINELKLSKPIKKGDFVKSSRYSWLIGTVNYPLSPWEMGPELNKNWEKAQEELMELLENSDALEPPPVEKRRSRRFSLKRNSKNLSSKMGALFANECLPRWREERQVNNAIYCLATDVEHCFQHNPAVVDRVFVMLLVGCNSQNDPFEDIQKGLENELHISNATFKDKGTTNEVKSLIKKEDANSRRTFHIISFKADFDVTEQVNRLEAKYPRYLHSQFPVKLGVEGKIYSLDIGCNAKLLYVYVSNCGKPNLTPFVELVANSVPSSSATLFESLFLDIDETLWIKCPYGWEYKEEEVKPNAKLDSPMQLRAHKEGKTLSIDNFLMKKLKIETVNPPDESALLNLASQQLSLLSEQHNNFLQISAPEKKRFVSSNKREIFVYLSECEYELKNPPELTPESMKKITHIEALVNTTGNHVWSLTYSSNLGGGYKQLFQTILSEIKTAED
ncbi:predicted protein [Naegleria gruberi]|uniref:Predicted protein n=1 Tax=Naegleria gruberi TaxID=5762 RepID=D2W3P4_NAEGR|nr:uncharacterized protein NAEGRDRAFT_60028 [Naegleria gruberi]EFC36297.1 predicted protein [Naegleria gruberi]|eukprot:XP_002669041.1 predicted protein [Naegleria gruberi strain NEG-M]